MFKKSYKVMLPDTDAAGILFFANYIKLAHYAYEEFMNEINHDLRFILDDADYLILIVHTEADYKSSLRLNDDYNLELSVTNIGRTSFTLRYDYLKDDKLAAMVSTTHVVVNKERHKPMAIPEKLVTELSRFKAN